MPISKRFNDCLISKTLNSLPLGPHRLMDAAKILGCNHRTVLFYVQRVGYREHYPEPADPDHVGIELAIWTCKGDGHAAASKLGCDISFVQKYIVAERAKGRLIGSRRQPTRDEVAAAVAIRRQGPHCRDLTRA